MVAGMGGNITSCMPDTSPAAPRRAAITGVATYVPDRVVTNADLRIDAVHRLWRDDRRHRGCRAGMARAAIITAVSAIS